MSNCETRNLSVLVFPTGSGLWGKMIVLLNFCNTNVISFFLPLFSIFFCITPKVNEIFRL